ncbi:hypothetical protein C21_00140 [Arenibacter sp. NBRC 103722]|nr:hypothetical protein C21_00140 [Arenibacter sp. NBRC 103722]
MELGTNICGLCLNSTVKRPFFGAMKNISDRIVDFD